MQSLAGTEDDEDHQEEQGGTNHRDGQAASENSDGAAPAALRGRRFRDAGARRLHSLSEVLRGCPSASHDGAIEVRPGLSAAAANGIAVARIDAGLMQEAAAALSRPAGLLLPDPLADHVRTPGELLTEARSANRLAAALASDVRVPGSIADLARQGRDKDK